MRVNHRATTVLFHISKSGFDPSVENLYLLYYERLTGYSGIYWGSLALP